MTTPEVPLGAKVQVAAGIGYTRWVGSNPPFAAGKWVGVELETPTGKNDGSVKGEKYFDCQPNHGVFVRPSQVKVLEAPKAARPTSMRPPPVPSSSRTSTTSVQRVTSPQKPHTAKAGPSTPPRKTSRAEGHDDSPPAGPSRRPSTAASAARPPSAASSVSHRAPSVTERAPRARPPSSSASGSNDVSLPPAAAPRAMSPLKRVTTPVEDQVISERPGATRSFSSVLSPTLPSIASLPDSAQAGPSRAPTPDREPAGAIFAQKRELEELRIRVRILEHRKSEDQDRMKGLEARATEADALRAARVKLQSKFQELQSSLVAAQRQSRDLQSENNHLQTRATEALDQLEMAALDREVAEEKAESAELEASKLSEKVAELELEIAILKEENAQYETPIIGIEGERTSIALVQLEKHNERLKEALIRLRDVSAEAERDHKSKISELKKEIGSQDALTGRLELSEAKLANAEAQVEDLKMQLDHALGAEDMLEQLTERNLQLGERIEEMRMTIEDLEAIKELNDELEENHVEAERQLNEEIDALRNQLREERVRSSELDGVTLDMEATLGQFRELASGLQSEIDMLRTQQETQEFESATTSKEAQALMNLNLKLQSSASKTQSKTIDLELKKLEVAQLAEHLRIVTAYLPEPYHETEADSATLLLFFQRLAAKADLLATVISQMHNLPSALYADTIEALVGVCELRGKLRHFASLNKRFAAVVSRTSSEDWLAFGKVLSDVGGVENRVDGWIDSLRSDQFKEGNCARELQSLIAQLEHLAASVFAKSQLDIAEQQLGLAHSFDYDLDNFAAAVGYARQAIQSLARDGDVDVDVGQSSLEEGVYEPVQRVLDLVRNVKVPSGKLVNQMEEVVHTSNALQPDVMAMLSDLAASVSDAVDLAVQLAQRIGAHVASLRASKQPLQLVDIERFLLEVTSITSAPAEVPPWEQIGMFVTRLGADLAEVLPKIRAAVKAGQVISMEIPPPWLARVAMIKEAAQYNADTERKVVRLSEEVKDMLREVKLRDQSLQEAGVKVETLERRLEVTRKQADVIIELENDVAKAKKQEKVYEDAIEQLQAEQDALEAETAKLRKLQAGGERQVNISASTEPLILGAGGLESAQLVEHIQNLRSAIRFLRIENSLLKSKDLYRELHLLPRLPYRSSTPHQPVPELDPSSPLSSPSSASSDLPVTPTATRHSLETEGKLLFQRLAEMQAKNRIVDISQLGGNGWKSRKKSPETQIWEWKREERKLEGKVAGLKERLERLAQRRS